MTISTLAQQLRKAQHVVIFTGAGASADAIHDDHCGDPYELHANLLDDIERDF
ncbi:MULTISPECIES: hypothetical protein [Pseudomonas chlororaphis group]|uniref:Uncharacterized protein n=1 Tax=Pseudomonas fragi TaxID=296 RepID=A0A449IEI8_PSEFR|nr:MULTISPECIES: hypothetical protein [Pseudomonas chlororaphis group]VFB17835.1 Uncharacterised protein [Pseudomonas fragi]